MLELFVVLTEMIPLIARHGAVVLLLLPDPVIDEATRMADGRNTVGFGETATQFHQGWSIAGRDRERRAHAAAVVDDVPQGALLVGTVYKTLPSSNRGRTLWRDTWYFSSPHRGAEFFGLLNSWTVDWIAEREPHWSPAAEACSARLGLPAGWLIHKVSAEFPYLTLSKESTAQQWTEPAQAFSGRLSLHCGTHDSRRWCGEAIRYVTLRPGPVVAVDHWILDRNQLPKTDDDDDVEKEPRTVTPIDCPSDTPSFARFLSGRGFCSPEARRPRESLARFHWVHAPLVYKAASVRCPSTGKP